MDLSCLNGKKTYIAAAIAALVAANGVLHWVPDDVMQTVIALAVSLGLAGIRHAIAKSNDVQQPAAPKDPGSYPRVARLPMILLACAVSFALCNATRVSAQTFVPCGLPWRDYIQDRISRLEKMQQQQPAAPAPQQQQPIIINVPSPSAPSTPAVPAPAPAAPQMIFMAPSQPSQPAAPANPPLQSLPIQGQPMQQLPIQGSPLQSLPIQGQPLQTLPVPGQPQQQLPLQGQPQQQLPMAAPAPTVPAAPAPSTPAAPQMQAPAVPAPATPVAPTQPKQQLPIGPPTGYQQYQAARAQHYCRAIWPPR